MRVLSVFDSLAEEIYTLKAGRFLRVAVDGVDGAGKSVFSDRLADAVEGLGRPAVRASVDGFHNTREVRYRRGRTSPEGFYLDSYNYASLRKQLLEPFGEDGSGVYQSAMFDHKTDTSLPARRHTAAPGTALIIDGIFLHRPELRECWDFSIYLDAPFEITIARCATRDGCSPDPAAPENRRYVEGQQRYISENQPHNAATVVVDNSDFTAPKIMLRSAVSKPDA